MKKRIWSLILAICMLITLVPSSVSAEETDYKEIYFDFLRDVIIAENYGSGVMLADLNFDGTPELILSGPLALSSYTVDIFQIVDGKVQLRYDHSPSWPLMGNSSYNMDYFDSSISDYKMMGEHSSFPFNSISLRKNKYTGELMYVHAGYDSAMDFIGRALLSFSKDKIFYAYEKFDKYIHYNDREEIESIDYKVDGNAVSETEYEQVYNEFFDTWQDTNYNFACLDLYDKSNNTEQQIRDFLNYYIPEKQFLGIADEDNTSQYGYVDVMPISRQEFDDCYDINVKFTNQSSETITNKRVVLACTTLTNSKTKRQTEIVAAYKDSEDVFNPYEEKNVITRIHYKKTSKGIPYTISDKPFSANYKADHSFFDNMILLTIQFANDKEYDEFMADIKSNNLIDLSTDENIENNANWLKALKGDK